MKPTIIRQKGIDILNQKLSPSCVKCKYFNKVMNHNVSPKERLIQSTCKKFLVNPMQNIYYEKSGLGGVDFREKHPYALMARFDVTMCGLNGKYFINK
jgi:hypothetical protein